MLAGGHAWIKASGAYRVGPAEGPWQGVAPLARALIDARPDRIVWGSDWPHTPPHGHDGVDHDSVMPFRPLDAGQLLDLLSDWAPDQDIRRCILVDNPARLYDFA
jgi:predicted TIM-barrel fold metal-dependent hydrolase